MIFDYSVTKTFNQTIDVVDAGNTALKCTSVNLLDYYIIIKTIFGKTHILKFGPVCPDLELLEEDFSVSYKKFDYKESTLFREIDKFINDTRKGIDSIEELTEFEAWEQFPPIKQYFENV
jgi:hypothetical protein